MAQAKKRQKFFDIEIPAVGKETQLYGYELEDFDGKTMKYDMTRMLRGKGALLNLKIKIEKDKAVAEPIGMTIPPYFIRRMMRKGTNYVEDSFTVQCKDATVKVKPFLITRKKVSREVRKALREKAREELTKILKDKKVGEAFDELMKNKIQKELSAVLKKIYPLSLCEIRVFTVEK